MKTIWKESTASTNDDAKLLAHNGAEHGTLLGADFQEKGRGRTGKSWECKAGEGLMCSIILRPSWERPYWGWIALLAGLAVVELLERDCLSPQIKWPNDILVNGKKIAGILTEASADAVIVGIGMNLNMATVPKVDSGIQPTSFLIETDCKLDPQSYAESVRRALISLTAVETPLLLRAEVTRRLAWLDERISLEIQKDVLFGEMSGLGEYGQLLLKTDTGFEEIFDAHQIRKI